MLGFSILGKMMLDNKILIAAKTLWNYHLIVDNLTQGKVPRAILGLGSYDLRVAKHAADLYLQNYASKIIFSGNAGNWTIGRWDKSEAEIFKEHAISFGVDKNDIILEPKASNIGENILFAKKIIEEFLPNINEIILITKPQTTRRAYATFMAHWQSLPVIVSAPHHDLTDIAEDYSIEELINEMVGDLERIIVYPAKNYQIKQEIPDSVMTAYRFLINSGYTKHRL